MKNRSFFCDERRKEWINGWMKLQVDEMTGWMNGMQGGLTIERGLMYGWAVVWGEWDGMNRMDGWMKGQVDGMN